MGWISGQRRVRLRLQSARVGWSQYWKTGPDHRWMAFSTIPAASAGAFPDARAAQTALKTHGARLRHPVERYPIAQEELFREIGVPVARRTTSPSPLDKGAEAAFVAKVKALAPKYRTGLLPHRLELWVYPQFNNPRSFAIGRILRTPGRTRRSIRDSNSADGDAWSG